MSDPVFARATVEQIARLLGRRAAKIFEGAAARAERDTTPIPKVPRITPSSSQMAVAEPSRSDWLQLPKRRWNSRLL